MLDFTSLPFRVERKEFTYLGITVTKKHKNLFKENVSALLSQVKRSITHWTPLSMSLVGRINSVKMTILPKFLYLFQALPIFSPTTFFNELDSVISSYLWQGKRPRLNKRHLQKSKIEGGFALPNFHFYYWAANIRCLVFWYFYHNRSGCPDWVTMELHSDNSISLPAALCSPLSSSSFNSIPNPIVVHSLKIWGQFRKYFKLCDFSLLSPIASNHLFKPYIQDGGFVEWHRSGLTCFKYLFIANKLASFEQLANKYSLPPSHFFRYLQVRHFICSQTSGSSPPPEPTLLETILQLNPTKRELISLLYNKMLNLTHISSSKLKTLWEEDLNMTISDETWASTLKHVNTTSLCARLCLIQFKVVHRAHFSKSRVSCIYPEFTPYCDRCKTAEASLIHMYWSCPSLVQFWIDICHTLSRILSVTLAPGPLIALFGISGNEVLVPASKIRHYHFVRCWPGGQSY
uniref:Reverse transcriptase zinc-binding domain-containing protein n=1 Tax=Oreochromis niloticus TaxID=8128 RepID=A0A669C0E2_ORENI